MILALGEVYLIYFYFLESTDINCHFLSSIGRHIAQ